MKRFLLSFALLIPFITGAQNLQLIDSLKSILPAEKTVERFRLLNDLAWEFRFAFPDSTLQYADEAYELGRELKLAKGLARPVNIMGVAYNYKGERISAFEHYSDALEISLLQDDSLQTAYSNNNLGRLFYEQGMLSRSYDYFHQARTIFKAINDSSGLAYVYQSLANLYKTQRDYPKAEANFLRAYQLRLSLGNTRDIMSAMNYLGRHYLEAGKPDKAIQFLQLADSTGRVINDEINRAEIKTYLAESYLATGRFRDAQRIASEGLQVISKRNNVRMMPQGYSIMGQVMMRQKNLAEARRYFQLSLDVGSRIKDLTAQMEAYYFLWQLSEQSGNAGEAIALQNRYLILKDSTKDLDLVRQVERLQFEMDIQRKERENELLKAKQAENAALIQQQRLQNIILIGIVASVSIVGLLQWIYARKRRVINQKLVQQNAEIQLQRQEIIEQNAELSQRNQQLSDLNREKDTLMSIVAHDLKSPLNRIEGIIYLMENDGRLSKSHQEYLDIIKDAMRSGLDLITDLLDVHMLEENVVPRFASFDISQFFQAKTEAFQQRANAKQIHLQITRVESELVFTDKDFLDRIFDNLVSNAIKFSPRHSVIEIAAGRTDNEFWLSVKDRGPGFSDADKAFLFQKFRKLSARPTAGESSNGLGLAIVKILCDRLRGKIELSSEQGKGSEFIIHFPQQKNLVNDENNVAV